MKANREQQKPDSVWSQGWGKEAWKFHRYGRKWYVFKPGNRRLEKSAANAVFDTLRECWAFADGVKARKDMSAARTFFKTPKMSEAFAAGAKADKEFMQEIYRRAAQRRRERISELELARAAALTANDAVRLPVIECNLDFARQELAELSALLL